MNNFNSILITNSNNNNNNSSSCDTVNNNSKHNIILDNNNNSASAVTSSIIENNNASETLSVDNTKSNDENECVITNDRHNNNETSNKKLNICYENSIKTNNSNGIQTQTILPLHSSYYETNTGDLLKQSQYQFYSNQSLISQQQQQQHNIHHYNASANTVTRISPPVQLSNTLQAFDVNLTYSANIGGVANSSNRNLTGIHRKKEIISFLFVIALV